MRNTRLIALALPILSAATANAAILFSLNCDNLSATLGPSPYNTSNSIDADPTPTVGAVSIGESPNRSIQVINGAAASSPDPTSTSKYVRLYKENTTSPQIQATYDGAVTPVDISVAFDFSGIGKFQLRNAGDVMLELQTIAGSSAGSFVLQYRNAPTGAGQYTTLTSDMTGFHSLAMTTDTATRTFTLSLDNTPLTGPFTYLSSSASTVSSTLYFTDTTTSTAFYLDNILATSVPEPSALAVLGVAAATLRRRHRGSGVSQ